MNHLDVFLFYFILLIHKPWKTCIILSFRKDDSWRCEQCAKNIFLFKSFKIQCWRQNHKDAPSLHSCFPWKFTGKTNRKFTLNRNRSAALSVQSSLPWKLDFRNTRNHTGQKTYSCQQCTKSLAVLAHLQRLLRVHSLERPFTCSPCTKSL